MFLPKKFRMSVLSFKACARGDGKHETGTRLEGLKVADRKKCSDIGG